MKLLLVALAIGASLCLVVASLGVSQDFQPSPTFQNAKTLAMASRPDVNGNFWNSVKKTFNGENVVYIVGWMPEQKLIGGLVIIGKLRGIVVFDCKDGHYEVGVYENDQLVKHNNISQEEADDLMKEVVNAIGMKGAIRY